MSPLSPARKRPSYHEQNETPREIHEIQSRCSVGIEGHNNKKPRI